MHARVGVAVAAAALLVSTGALAHRLADRHPDLQGFWTNGTATPFQRPAELAEKLFFTESEAAEWERGGMERLLKSLPKEDREMGVDLNETYLDTATLKVVDDRRTSLIVDPPDGRLPPQLLQARERAEKRPKPSFDNPETIGLDERCLLATALGTSNATPPMVPNPLAQNFYQIVQTPDSVLIFTEVVHDARIIRIDGRHAPPTIQKWLGDSIGWWDGDTLVVDTTNFSPKTHFRGSSERLHVVERFTRTNANTIRYRVTAEDPETWARSWTAEIPFKATNSRIFEYACHEGNYAVENYLRGARAEEKRK
jgi:hypothetical protein